MTIQENELGASWVTTTESTARPMVLPPAITTGFSARRWGTYPNGTDRGLADLIAASELGMSRRVAHYIEDRLYRYVNSGPSTAGNSMTGCFFLHTISASKEPR